MADDTTGGALSGLRVLDVGLLVQGPQAGQLMADLGAEVIKVELPEVGDQARWIPISFGQDLRAPWFIACNRGKRAITLDLRTDAGREVFLDLVETADVVISNFLPGTLEGWGLGYDDLAARNPRIVLGSGSAYGPIGPDSDREGADLGGQAAGGILSMIGDGLEHAQPIGVTVADHIGSQNLLAGVLAALLHRERSGRGQRVEVSLYGGQIFAQASELVASMLSGSDTPPGGQGHSFLPAIYGVFPTADGWIAVVGVPPAAKEAFWSVVDRPDLAEVERYNTMILPPDVKQEVFALLAEVLPAQTTEEWMRRFRAAGVRYAPVRRHSDIAADPAAFENGYLQRVDHPEWGEVIMPGCPIRMSATPASPGTIAPELGQHTEEILLELGRTWDDIASLRDAGAI